MTARALSGLRSGRTIFLGGAAAILLGLGSDHLAPVAVGLVTLLPLVSHVRWVGWRRAIAEPSAATIIVGFYVAVFPLRGLVIAASGYTDVDFVRGVVSGEDLVAALVLASLATTALLEAFYAVRGPERHLPSPTAGDRHANVMALAGALGLISLGALVGVLVQFGGLAGAQSELLSHSTESLLQGQRTIPESIWWVLAVPAVWSAAYVAVDVANDAVVRWAFASLGILIVLAELIVFGSRLNAILALVGAWIVWHYSGRPLPVRVILIAIPVLILLSVPIVSERGGGYDTSLSTVERYSRIAGYGVLDASLAVHQEPDEIRAKMRDPQRWFDMPAYFAPSSVWPDKPNIDSRRMGLYLAQTLGDQNQQATGWPSTYITEGWLYAGWPGVLLVSLLFGAVLGVLHRRLVGWPRRPLTPAALLCYCFVATVAFGYYKDGDALVWFVGNGRSLVYLAVAVLAAGVWTPLRRWTAAPPVAQAAAAPAAELRSSGADVESAPPAAGAWERPVLYLMSEHPSVSETFIVNEAATVRELGVPVVGYALRRGAVVRSAAADIDLVCPPPTRSQLAAASVEAMPAFLSELRRARPSRLSRDEKSRLLFALAHAAYLAPWARRAGVAHVHAHFLGRSSDVAAALAPQLGCRWTATAHGQDVYAPVEPGLLRHRLASVAAVACANRGLERRLHESFGAQTPPTTIVHCGVHTESLMFAPEAPSGAPHLVTVGRLVATKGHWTVLEAAAQLMPRHPSLRWTVVGDGPLHDELVRDPRARRLAPRLTFAGAMDHASALEVVTDATAFVLPCETGAHGESDGIPVALMEAMALGVPVVTTPTAGIPELVADGETGILVSPQDWRSLVAALERILDPASADELGRIRAAAREKVEREFDQVQEAGRMVELLAAHLPGASVRS